MNKLKLKITMYLNLCTFNLLNYLVDDVDVLFLFLIIHGYSLPICLRERKAGVREGAV